MMFGENILSNGHKNGQCTYVIYYKLPTSQQKQMQEVHRLINHQNIFVLQPDGCKVSVFLNPSHSHSVLLNLADNGLNPVWNDSCDFEVLNPQLALLRFQVQDEDIFGDSNFIGQATYPVSIVLAFK